MCVIADQTQGVVRPTPERFAGLPIAQAALKFASARHAGQYRESDHAPFIAHPIAVGRLLHRDGQPDEVVAAGLLHDLLEKTRTTSSELQRRFGDRIARLVESVSDDPSIVDYEQRKSQLRDRVAHAERATLAIFAADKIAKVRELVLLPTGRLHDTQTRAKLAHYRASLEMLRQTDTDSPLVDLLDAQVNRFVAPAGSGTQNDDQATTLSNAKRSKLAPRRSR
jgi:(p)ppGpp synthase/HD superfamily hydrolase